MARRAVSLSLFWSLLLGAALPAAAAPVLVTGTVTPTQLLGNGDAVIDPGEDWSLVVRLNNSGDETATAISAVLSAGANVAVTAADANYPDIAAAGNGDNTTPYAFSVFNLACGSSLGLSLQVNFTSPGGAVAATLPVPLVIGGAGAPQSFSVTGAFAVADGVGAESPGATLDIPVTVAGAPNVIGDVDFRFNGSVCNTTMGSTTVGFDHTFVGDLVIELVSPAGTSLPIMNRLSNGGGGNSGNNLCQTHLDDEATALIQAQVSAAAPFTGDFRPANALGVFDGQNSNGTWHLRVTDFFVGDVGNVRSFTLDVAGLSCNAFSASTALTASKTVSGVFQPGGAVTYTVTLSNSGPAAQADNAGNEFVDALPAALTLVAASSSSGSVGTAGNTVSWNGALAAGASTTITINATINAGTAGTVVSNQATLAFDGNHDGNNEGSALSDDPGVGGASDPTVFTVVGTPAVSATKTVAGAFTRGSTATYTVVLNNTGGGTQPDNAGDEFTDVLPADVVLVAASASSGTTVATIATNTVTWNGAIPSGGSVTLTITTTVSASAAIGAVISNQGSVSFDADANGSNESTAPTDDPAVAGGADPTRFTVIGTATIAATKTVAGTFIRGGAVTYTVTLTNSGSGAQADNAGNEFTDVVPATITGVSATASSGTAATAGNTVTWNRPIAAAGSVTITIAGTVSASAPIGGSISNQGTLSFDGDGNGSNESTGQTDDPAAAGAANPTTFMVQGTATITATKTAAGSFVPGGNVTYTVVIANNGSAAQGDNAGNEFTDVVPAAITAVTASASSGLATVAGNTVNWNGAIAAGSSVQITIAGTVSVAAAPGTTISNQGTVSFDADGNATNESALLTDDPAIAGGANPTTFGVIPLLPVSVPTLSGGALAALVLLMLLMVVRRRAGAH